MNILIADDHKIFREGISQLIQRNSKNITHIEEANNGEETISILKKSLIDVVLLDVNMPLKDGIETAKEIKKFWPEVKIIMLTMHDSQKYIKHLMEIGVHGYLLKTVSSQELLEAIETVLNDENYYDKNVQVSFLESFSSNNMEQDIHLTKRERDILKLICEELNTNEIADELCISAYTVETHRKNLLSKTGAKNVAGLVKFALNNNL